MGLALVLGPLVSAPACSSSTSGAAKACDVRWRGIKVSRGQVVDAVRPFCSPRPTSHVMRVRLEMAVGGEWVPMSRSSVVDRIPDEAGFVVEVSAPCREGTWRTAVRVDGIGPAPTAIPFDDDLAGDEVEFTLVDCAR